MTSNKGHSLETQKTSETVRLSGIPRAAKALESLGDINLSVIYSQLEVGKSLSDKYGVDASMFYISREWWDSNVTNNGTFTDMAEKFDAAYKVLVAQKLSEITQTEIKVEEGGGELHVDQSESGQVEDAEGASRSYEMLENLGAALTEAENNAIAFAKRVDFDSCEAYGETFLIDLIEHVATKYELNLSEAQLDSILEHVNKVMRFQRVVAPGDKTQNTADGDIVTVDAEDNFQVQESKPPKPRNVDKTYRPAKSIERTPTTLILTAGTQEYRETESRRLKIENDFGVVDVRYRDEKGNEIVALGTRHTFDPEDPEIEFLDRVVRERAVDPQTVLILEGHYSVEDQKQGDPREAVRQGGGEFNYLSALGSELGIDVIPAEPDIHDTARTITEDDPTVSSREVALHYTLKTLDSLFKGTTALPAQDIGKFIYNSASTGGVNTDGGITERKLERSEVLKLSPDEEDSIIKELPTIVADLNEAFSEIIPGQTLLEIDAEGNIRLCYDLSQSPVLWDPSLNGTEKQTAITRISQLDMLARDKHTFSLIQQALNDGKQPIVAVGSSHTSTLRPALDAAYTYVA